MGDGSKLCSTTVKGKYTKVKISLLNTQSFIFWIVFLENPSFLNDFKITSTLI